jgi:hypothetical protein
MTATALLLSTATTSWGAPPSRVSTASCASNASWTSKPFLSAPAGNPPVGTTLTVSNGTITGIPIGCAYEIRYQWYRYNTSLDVSPFAISNSNTASYTLTTADVGFAVGACLYAYPGQIPNQGGNPRTLDCSAASLTVRAADPAPTPAPQSAAAPAPAPTTATVAPKAPAGVKWTTPPSSKVAYQATFSAAPNTTYAISAAPAAKKKSGTCSAKSGKVTCKIKLTKGKWIVSITPISNGISGTPVKKTIVLKK